MVTVKRPAGVCVVGLGFAGLPLAIQFWKAGFHVTGIDVDANKIRTLQSRRSYINDVTDKQVEELFASGAFDCTTEFDEVAAVEAVIVCVPTPVNDKGLPDLRFVLEASRSVARHLREGQMFILESSTFPGTTEDYIVPILQTRGLTAGDDFYVAYSPERINPGETFELRKIPKVIGGLNEISLVKGVSLYRQVFDTVVPVSSTRVAELTKLVENTQRLVNISMMNKLAIVCNQLGISLWEAIEAASTKPYGFSPYYPGPGVGGHCIPVDPLYLEWLAKRCGQSLEFIKVAHRINEEMPKYIADRILALTDNKSDPRVLLVGVTYKRDVNDVRESSSLQVLEDLLHRCIDTQYFDPYVPDVTVNNQTLKSVPLHPDEIRQFDVVAILTDHTKLDYSLIAQHAKAVLDTRNVFRKNPSSNVVLL